MSKAKVNFISNHEIMDCWGCESKGYIIKNNYKRECKLCGGIGKFVEKNYYLLYIDKNGLKQAFMVDSLK